MYLNTIVTGTFLVLVAWLTLVVRKYNLLKPNATCGGGSSGDDLREAYEMLSLGKWEEAVTAATRLLENRPFDSCALACRAIANKQTGNLDAAEADLKTIVSTTVNFGTYEWAKAVLADFEIEGKA